MIKKLIVAFALYSMVFVQTVQAAPLPSAGWQRGVSSTGQSIWFGPGYATKTSADIGRDIWAAATSSGSTLTSARTLALGAGDVAVTAKAVATGAEIFLAAKALAGGPLGIGLTALTLVPVVASYFTTSDVRLGSLADRASDKPFLVRDLAGQCFNGTCYEYSYGGTSWGSKSAAVSNGMDVIKAGLSPGQSCGATNFVEPSTQNYQCTYLGYTNDASFEIMRRPLPPGWSEKWLPASMDDIARYMDKPVSPDEIKALINAGAQIKLSSPSVTGPSAVTAPPVVTTTNDGTNTTTKTSTKKDTVSYSTGPSPSGSQSPGQSVPKVTGTTNTTTITNIKNNTTNNIISTVTTTENNPAPAPDPVDDTPEEDLGEISDTPFGDIPKLYERKYPDGMKGVWDEKITAIKAAPLFTLVGSLMPESIGSSGSCPSFMIPVNFGQWGEYGSLDFSPPCMVWDFGKVIIIISSLLLARRLIFGG